MLKNILLVLVIILLVRTFFPGLAESLAHVLELLVKAALQLLSTAFQNVH